MNRKIAIPPDARARQEMLHDVLSQTEGDSSEDAAGPWPKAADQQQPPDSGTANSKPTEYEHDS